MAKGTSRAVVLFDRYPGFAVDYAKRQGKRYKGKDTFYRCQKSQSAEAGRTECVFSQVSDSGSACSVSERLGKPYLYYEIDRFYQSGSE